MARNLKWTRDETIIALDFYLKHRDNAIRMKGTPEMVAMSKQLNKFATLHNIPKGENFRSPNSFYLKLMNFHNIDPAQTKTAGLSNHSKGDEATWDDFAHQPEILAETANAIHKHLADAPPIIETTENILFEPTIEGRILSSSHIRRERNPRLAEKLKDNYYDKHKYLDCAVCGFDYERQYGKHGHRFMEAHHIRPLSELPPEGTATKQNDLALICASCHRMVHRKSPWLTLEQLRGILTTPHWGN